MKGPLLALAAACVVNAAPEWCVGPPQPKGDAYANSELDFRGSYRDFALYIEGEAGKNVAVSCNSIGVAHLFGDDGLWVLEFPDRDSADRAVQNATRAGLRIRLRRGNSLVSDGGTRLPSIMGFDACGASQDVAIIPVPSRPLHTRYAATNRTKVEWRAAAVRPIAAVAKAVAAVSESQLRRSVRQLQAFRSRNSYGRLDAQRFLQRRLEMMGYTVSLQSFDPAMSTDVVAELRPNTEPQCIVVAGAHYDSRAQNSSDATERAPGADDNATGSAAMLEIARVLSAAGMGLACTVRIVLFSGEEQGLLGSRALAAQWAEAAEPIIAMVNADMLGYHIGNTPITLGFKDRYVTEELVELARGLAKLYVPGLPTAFSSSCCSDYMSFYENGFASVGFFENAQAASSYPHYHTRTDKARFVNFRQLTLEVRAVLATVATVARPTDPDMKPRKAAMGALARRNSLYQ